MIRIFLGKLGSGKSAYAVREMARNVTDRVTYTNIVTKGISNVRLINPQDVIRKKVIDEKKKKYELDLNVEYWAQQKKPLNVVWDEVHLTANSRMSTSKANMVLSRFIAMARRITGFDERGYGTFTFIAQKERTIDVNVRELANEIIYLVSKWVVRCEECGLRVFIHSEMPQYERCYRCGSWKVVKGDLILEVFHFNDWFKLYNWEQRIKGRWHFKREIITDIESYFRHYDTLQIGNVWDTYVSLR